MTKHTDEELNTTQAAVERLANDPDAPGYVHEAAIVIAAELERRAERIKELEASNRESAWLIEQDSPARGSVWFSADGPQWRFTSDANEALRFSRKQDAETFIKWLGGNPLLSNPRATEHIWISGKAQAADWSEYEDEISDAISDSIDMDWTSRDGAKAVVRLLNTLSATPPAAPSLPADVVERFGDAIDAITRIDAWIHEIAAKDEGRAISREILRYTFDDDDGGALLYFRNNRVAAGAFMVRDLHNFTVSMKVFAPFADRVAGEENLTASNEDLITQAMAHPPVTPLPAVAEQTGGEG